MGPPRSVRAAQTRGGPVGLASVFRAEKIWFWVVALKYANHTKMGPGGRTDHPLLGASPWEAPTLLQILPVYCLSAGIHCVPYTSPCMGAGVSLASSVNLLRSRILLVLDVQQSALFP